MSCVHCVNVGCGLVELRHELCALCESWLWSRGGAS